MHNVLTCTFTIESLCIDLLVLEVNDLLWKLVTEPEDVFSFLTITFSCLLQKRFDHFTSTRKRWNAYPTRLKSREK